MMRISRSRLSLMGALFWVLAVLMPALVALGLPQTASAQTKVYHMERYDSNITVNSDGSLDIQETLVYAFTSGSFRRGLRTWDTDKLEGMSGFSVTEVRNGLPVAYRETGFDPDDSTSGRQGTYGVEETGSEVRLRWIYGPTSNQTRTFVISYHVDGAIRVYDDRDELDWYAVPPEWGAPIYSSRVESTFPEGSDTSNWKVAAQPSDAEIGRSGNVITWTASGTISDGGFEVGAQIPKGVLAAQKPSWQLQQDAIEKQQEEENRRQQEYDRNVRPLVDFGLLILGALLLVGGILWSVMTWYQTGRDKPVALPADYLADPPSDLPPGLVGTLLDESADIRDVIATVVDMAKKGNLTIAESDPGGFLQGKDFEYRKTGNQVSYRFEEMVLDAMFKTSDSVRLSELKNKFYTSLPDIYSEMYKTLVALKYFPESPKTVRTRNSGIGCAIIALGLAAAFLWFTFGAMYSWMIIVPAIGLGATGLVRMFMAGAMPRKTDMGSEQAERWRAFKRYLQQIQTYTNVQEAADRFQKYLPYAVAMGVDREFINQFNSVPTAMPTWYAPYGYYPYPYVVGGPGPGTANAGGPGTPTTPMPGFDPGGAVQGMSNSLGAAMQGMSDSFTSMVNSASNILTSQPSSSGSSGGGGGGWGGGGGSFGGGGGGGGGGGAD
jgi:uncharacterized membrane protein